MTKSFLGCFAIVCIGCGGDVDLGGAGGDGGAGGAAGAAGGSGGSQAGTGGAAAGSGGGGAGSGGTAGAGGATGGTSSVACSTFKRTGDPVKVSSDDESSRPTLVRLGTGAAVVYRRPSPSPSPGFEVLYPSWTDPWNGAWTAPPPASTSLTGLSNKYEDTVQAAEGALPGSVAVLHSAADNACMSLSRPIPDHTTLAGFGCPPPSFTYGPNPAALVAGPAAPTGSQSYLTAHVTGYGGLLPTNYQLNVARVDLPTGVGPGTIASKFDSLGCATKYLQARAWYSQTAGYLMAFTTSRPFYGCGVDLYADGPPNRLQIVSFGPSGDVTKKPQLLHEVVVPNAILTLALAVRADGGAWIAFQAASSSKELDPPGPIQALAVDAAGKPTTPVKSVVPQASGLGSSDPAAYAATTLGNRLVLGGSWASPDCTESCYGIRFHIVDASSPENAPPNYIADPSYAHISSPISLLASPDGSRLIAAYSDWTGNPTDVWAERFECVP